MRQRPHTQSGFSLVELSIVIVVLGLLIGGVFSSRALIRTYELKTVRTQLDTITSAANSFRTKYKFLPGDMPNATDFWGIAGGTGNDATCRTTASTGAETCNGDGDGEIEYITAGSLESLRFWQHLSNGEFIEGRFTGVYNGATVVDTTNLYKGKVTNTIWAVVHNDDQSGDTHLFDGAYGNVAWLRRSPDSISVPPVPILTNEEMFTIDTKTDDGLPATGFQVAYAPGTTPLSDCATNGGTVTSASLESTYRLAVEEPVCVILFRDLF